MLVKNIQNLMQAVTSIIHAAEAASVKVDLITLELGLDDMYMMLSVSFHVTSLANPSITLANYMSRTQHSLATSDIY